MIGWPEKRVNKLLDLLDAKALNYIEMIEFDYAENKDDDVDQY